MYTDFCLNYGNTLNLPVCRRNLSQNGNRVYDVHVKSGGNRIKRAGLMDLGPLQASKPGPKKKNEER